MFRANGASMRLNLQGQGRREGGVEKHPQGPGTSTLFNNGGKYKCEILML